MENNIPTSYILQRDSYVVKSAKIRPFCQKDIKHSSYSNQSINQSIKSLFKKTHNRFNIKLVSKRGVYITNMEIAPYRPPPSLPPSLPKYL